MLEQFFSENGIVMNGISIQSNASAGMHVRAMQKLKEGQVVAKIPKEVVLSIKNTAIADVLQEYEIAGLLGLTLALMFEQAKGQASPWYEYLISLPEKVEIPLLWDANQIDWLDGTELGESVMADQMALREDYDSIIVPILKEPVFCPLEEFSFEKFQNASSLVSSRAFDVDEYHQHSMVPLADIFNHFSRENVHFQCNSNVCEYCGESGICDCEIIDHINETGNMYQENMGNDYTPEENDLEETDEAIMEMVVVRPCEINEEVFNTYGNHSNSYLLNRYGFCEENNPNDVINFEKVDVLDLLKQLSIKLLSKRIVFWEKMGRKMCHKLETMHEIQKEVDFSEENIQEYVEEENDTVLDDGFYLDFYHQPSFHLYCFLQLMLMTSSSFNTLSTDITKYESLIEKLAYRKWSSDIAVGEGDDDLKISKQMSQIIYLLCKDRLAKYPTTLMNDVDLYDSIRKTNQQKLKSSLILRISDKRILHGYLDTLKSNQEFKNNN